MSFSSKLQVNATITKTRIALDSVIPPTSTSKPSLIHPDFSGLWSVSRLGHKKKWWSKLAGSAIVSLFLYSWVGGFILPFIVIYLLIIGYTTTACLLASMLILPYLLRIKPQPWICRIYMKYGPHYFDGGCSIIIEKEPVSRDPAIPICAAIHPHGIFCMGAFFAYSNRSVAIKDIKDEHIREEFMGKISRWKHYEQRWPEIGLVNKMLVHSPLFNLLFTKIAGNVESASKKNVKSLMEKGVSFGMYPAGFYEASIHKKGENVIYVKQRKGLIKYCLEYGYEIYPVYVFGECETYYNYNEWISMDCKRWLNKNQIPAIFAFGPYWYCSPLLPFSNTGIHWIYGCNTYYEKVENPSQEKIDEVHKWYMDEIENIFERNKWRFGYDQDIRLKII